jgi:hypothetical protein
MSPDAFTTATPIPVAVEKDSSEENRVLIISDTILILSIRLYLKKEDLKRQNINRLIYFLIETCFVKNKK